MVFKVCGMTDGDNIRDIENAGTDIIGFIFYPLSPRYLREVPGYLPATSQRAGVFVNEKLEIVEKNITCYKLDLVQLHGNESPEYCAALYMKGYKIIKVFSIHTPDDLSETSLYHGLCDYFLFDTKCGGYGGSGKKFDWDILHEYKGDTPFLLSGGIGPDSLNDLTRFRHPKLIGYDLNSRFEIQPGYKDADLVKSFITRLT